VTPASLSDDWIDLPLLFHYGRSDATVAFYGANLPVADVEEAVFSVPELSERVTSFTLLAGEDAQANKTLELAFELRAGTEPPADVRGPLLAQLARVNQDWREAARFMPSEQPTLSFHAPGTGPFAGYDPRLKRKYVSR
jgi:phenylacetate-coenzyme A ligase PaaK-like adenylate-forming protein